MNRPDEISEELVSAYLDGEVTAEEQARVENLLADSPRQRRMFEEFRELRDCLQSLPQLKAPDRLLDHVLESIERSGGEDADSRVKSASARTAPVALDNPANGAALSHRPIVETPHRRRLRGALIAAGGMAAAAALLAAALLVGGGNQEVAVRPDAADDANPTIVERDVDVALNGEKAGGLTAGQNSSPADERRQPTPPGAERATMEPPIDIVAAGPAAQRDRSERSMAESMRRDDAVSLPPPDAPPRSSPPNEPGAPRAPVESRIVYLFEITLTPRGVENDILRRSLEAAGAPYEAVFEVDAESARAVSAARKFGRIGKDDQVLCAPLTREQKEIVFRFLQTQTADVVRIQHDLPEVPSTASLYGKIAEFEKRDLKAEGPDKLIPFLFVLKKSR